MLGLRHELADRHVFDHAPAQRADGLVGHGGAPVLSEVVEHLDLRTGRFHRLRLLIITRAAPQAPYRERFSPLTLTGSGNSQTGTAPQRSNHALRRPASEKRQGTKSRREMVRRRCRMRPAPQTAMGIWSRGRLSGSNRDAT